MKKLLSNQGENRKPQPNFRKVSDLQAERELFFGNVDLDQFLGGLCVGHVIFLYGSWQCLAISKSLCLRVQLSRLQGGLNSKAIFLDGGNTFDPYLVSQYAERFSIDQDLALDRILVARAFTYHQMTSLITETLPQAVYEEAVEFVVISDILELYHGSDTTIDHTIPHFKIALNSMITTARSARAIILATSFDTPSDSDPFLRAIRQRADVVLRLEERQHATKYILEKHLTRSGEILLREPAPKILEEFLETDRSG